MAVQIKGMLTRGADPINQQWYQDSTGWHWNPDYIAPPSLLRTSSSFRLQYIHGSPPAGYIDKVYTSFLPFTAEAEGTLQKEVTAPADFITLTGLKSARGYYVRIFRYYEGVMVETSNEEFVSTTHSPWKFGPSSLISNWQTIDDFFEDFQLGQDAMGTIPQINPIAAVHSSIGQAIKFPLNNPNGNVNFTAYHSKYNWELVPPYEFEIQVTCERALSSHMPATASLTLYNGEGLYSGIYLSPTGAGAWLLKVYSNMLENTPTITNIGDTTPTFSYILKYTVDETGWCTLRVNNNPIYQERHLTWPGPVGIWIQNNSPRDTTANYYKGFKATVPSAALKKVAGFWGWQNTGLMALQQPNYPGMGLHLSLPEFDPRTTPALTAEKNFPELVYPVEWLDPEYEWMEWWIDHYNRENEEGMPRLFKTGNFGGALPEVVLPEDHHFGNLKLWGRQLRGYCKVRVRDATTHELIPENELPGNAAGFLPNIPATTMKLVTKETLALLAPLVIDASGITATSVYLEIDGYYDGGTLSEFTDSSHYYPSALIGASFEASAIPDTEPPVTACDREAGEYPGNTLITLSEVGTDPSQPVVIFYRWGTGEWQTYSVPFVMQEATLQWYGQDAIGNPEAVNSLAFTLETVPPVTACSLEAGEHPYGTPITLSEVGTDPSQPVTIYYRWGSTGSFLTYSSSLSLTQSGTLNWYGQDSAGNLEAVNSVVLTIAVSGSSSPLFTVSGQSVTLYKIDGSIVTVVKLS